MHTAVPYVNIILQRCVWIWQHIRIITLQLYTKCISWAIMCIGYVLRQINIDNHWFILKLTYLCISNAQLLRMVTRGLLCIRVFWMLRIIFYMCKSIILNLLILKYETPIFKVFMNAPFNVINSSFAFIAWKENGSLHKTVFRIIFLLNGVFKAGRVSSCIRVEQPRINPSSDVVEWPSTYAYSC